MGEERDVRASFIQERLLPFPEFEGIEKAEEVSKNEEPRGVPQAAPPSPPVSAIAAEALGVPSRDMEPAPVPPSVLEGLPVPASFAASRRAGGITEEAPGDSERSAATLRSHIVNRSPSLVQHAKSAVKDCPKDAELLLLAMLAALIEEQPDRALVYHKRFSKYYVPDVSSHLFHAIALAQKKYWSQASRVVSAHTLGLFTYYKYMVPCGIEMAPWIRDWLKTIDRESKRAERAPEKPHSKTALRTHAKPRPPATSRGDVAAKPEARQKDGSEEAALAPPLPRLSASISIRFNLPASERIVSVEETQEDPIWFQLRSEFAHLSLLQGFDEMLCLPLLRNVRGYCYQVETVRKVLKQFRGRVLLADEVGLGKTIEAGMVLKEYMLRGMAEKVLILTPASMVGQWLEEMETKFDIEFASTYNNLVRRDAAAFWSQPRVIASIATARRAEHVEQLSRQVYDLVIVDEAHHLKNRTTNNWRLANALKKRFLLLLSATPVQNSLVELYNMLTLLKPGIFKTEKEFRSTYVTPGKPRVPLNRDQMRDLMRDVMIRNTRSQVDVRLPPRTAVTLWVNPAPDEAACYEELSRLVQESHQDASSHLRLALRHLLSAAGSSPAAAAAAVRHFADTNGLNGPWPDLQARYKAIGTGSKESALLDLLKRNPEEKKIVFVRHRETLNRLDSLLRSHSIHLERFEGSMNGLQKDIAIDLFREEVPVLLSTESGGEGRNMQFCNTLINFDLPWNPMAIEQRIGRLHRIGQTRQVFIFNLAVRNTLEEYLLRILDEKINMFELVVGEIGAILGEMEDSKDFSEMVFDAWIGSAEQERPSAFDDLGRRVAEARRQYEAVKMLDENLFGDEFVAG